MRHLFEAVGLRRLSYNWRPLQVHDCSSECGISDLHTEKHSPVLNKSRALWRGYLSRYGPHISSWCLFALTLLVLAFVARFPATRQETRTSRFQEGAYSKSPFSKSPTHVPPKTPLPQKNGHPVSSSSGSLAASHCKTAPDQYLLEPLSWSYNESPQTRSFKWTVSNSYRRPDGVLRRMTLINGEFPGPLIECNSGDTVRISSR